MLADRLLMLLISPDLTAYRTKLSENVMVIDQLSSIFYFLTTLLQKMIKQKPETFKTPPEMFADPEAQNKLQQLVEFLLTQRRSTIKSKVGSAFSHAYS